MKTIVFAVVLLPFLVVQSHPINMICVPVCSPNVTANETLINDWLSNDDSTGIDQLLDHEDTVIKSLKNLSSTDVSTLLWVHVHVFKDVYIQSCKLENARMHLTTFSLQRNDCSKEYKRIVTVPKTTNVSVNSIRQFFNAYYVHELFVEHLMNSTDGLLYKDWVYQAKVYELNEQLAKLKSILQYNVKSLAMMVSNS